MSKIEYKADCKQFEEGVKSRKITRLVHFTPFVNLISIAEQQALLAVSELERIDHEHLDLYLKDYVQANDKLRLDGMRDYINISIEHPNHLLFNRFRSSHRTDWFEPWCVIAIKPEVLWRKGVLFSIGNAASRLSKAVGFGESFEMFESLFNESITAGNINGSRILNRQGLAHCYPTDVQAEVLIHKSLSLGDIKSISFETKEGMAMARAAFLVKGLDFYVDLKVDQLLFKERCTNG